MYVNAYMSEQQKFLYGDFTWEELNEIAGKRVAILPVTTIEDHGPHLPVDVDVAIGKSIVEVAASRAASDCIVLPVLPFGYSPHHLDFPGPITINWDTMIKYLLSITNSLIIHKFNRILLFNAHGSNVPLIDLAARLTIVDHPNAICGAVSWWSLPKVREVLRKIRNSAIPGGMAHACEAETSLYMYLYPERVRYNKIKDEIGFPKSDYVWFDFLQGQSPVMMMEYWSTMSETGTMGEPSKATREKGALIFEAAVEGLLDIVKEFKARRIGARVDHHA
jgi:creatinine amidohydrolase